MIGRSRDPRRTAGRRAFIQRGLRRWRPGHGQCTIGSTACLCSTHLGMNVRSCRDQVGAFLRVLPPAVADAVLAPGSGDQVRLLPTGCLQHLAVSQTFPRLGLAERCPAAVVGVPALVQAPGKVRDASPGDQQLVTGGHGQPVRRDLGDAPGRDGLTAGIFRAGLGISMIRNSASGRTRRVAARNSHRLSWIRSGPTLTSQNTTSPGSRQANTSKNPARLSPFPALTVSKISAAHRAAPAAARVANAGAGNQSRRRKLPNADTQTPRQPVSASSLTTPSSAQTGRLPTATIGLRDQMPGKPGGSGSPSHRVGAYRNRRPGWQVQDSGRTLRDDHRRPPRRCSRTAFARPAIDR
jgi:hypothetical protein